VSFAPESLPPPSSAVAQENNSALNNRSSVDASVGSANADNVTPVVPEVEVSKISDTPKKDDVVVDNSRSHASTKPLVEQKATQQYPSIAPAINKKIEISDSAASLSSVAANGDQRSRAGESSSRPNSSIPLPVEDPQTSSSNNVAGATISSLSTSSSMMTDTFPVPRMSFASSRRGSRAEEDMLHTERELPEPLAASLGDAGRSELTPQQVQIIYRMFELLRAGVQVIKHSRTSKPHFRTLYCDKEMKVLFWRQSGDSADVEDGGAPKKRGIFGRRSSFTRMDVEREISFSDITAVSITLCIISGIYLFYYLFYHSYCRYIRILLRK